MHNFLHRIYFYSVCGVMLLSLSSPVRAQETCSGTNWGNVNADADVDIADVVTMVNVVLGETSEDEVDVPCADLNCDAVINVLDVFLLVDMLIDLDTDNDGDTFCGDETLE